jgi:hypothetical protein
MDSDLPFFNEDSLGFLNSSTVPLPPISIVNPKTLEGPFIAHFVPAPYSVIQNHFHLHNCHQQMCWLTWGVEMQGSWLLH